LLFDELRRLNTSHYRHVDIHQYQIERFVI
jgi:hypothetical protein